MTTDLHTEIVSLQIKWQLCRVDWMALYTAEVPLPYFPQAPPTNPLT